MVKRLPHAVFVEIHHWVAVVFLVAGIDQRVQGKRIIVRSGDVFFDERAEHPGFDVVQDYVHCVNPFEADSSLTIVQRLWPSTSRALLDRTAESGRTDVSYRIDSFNPRISFFDWQGAVAPRYPIQF